jgi:uncharacterized protein YdeI (YjbR/CyaY-like superfamily)
MAELPTELPIVPFASQQDWEDWLRVNADEAAGLWLQIAKKAAGIPTVSYDEALEVALCYGWIDGLKKRYDERFFIQRFTPRRPRSRWSKRNVGIVERLIQEGRMKPRGLREVEAAKADGRWDSAYEGPGGAEPHPEMLTALRKAKKAQAFFDKLTKRQQDMLHHYVGDAKKPKTRARRIDKLVATLKEGKRPFG